MHEVLVNRLGGLSLPRKSVVRLTDRPDMTLDVYRGRKTTMQQQQQQFNSLECTKSNLNAELNRQDFYYILHSILCETTPRNSSSFTRSMHIVFFFVKKKTNKKNKKKKKKRKNTHKKKTH